jgi:hypothetical protein
MNRLKLIRNAILTSAKPVFKFEEMANEIVDFYNNPNYATIIDFTDNEGKTRRCLRIGFVAQGPTFDMTQYFEPQPGRFLHLYYECLNKRSTHNSSWLFWRGRQHTNGDISTLYPSTGAYSEEDKFTYYHAWSYNAAAGTFQIYQETRNNAPSYIDIDSFRMWVDDTHQLIL